MTDILKKSTARNLAVFMVDSADHVTGKTGLTLTITASKDCAAFASITPTVTELANGWYKLALTSSHTDTIGDLAIHITSTGADPTDLKCQVIAYDIMSGPQPPVVRDTFVVKLSEAASARIRYFFPALNTAGAPVTGLSGSVNLNGRKPGGAGLVADTAAITEVDATTCPGLYFFTIPSGWIDAAGVGCFEIDGDTSFVDVVQPYKVVGTDDYDTVRGGMTALPNANAEAAGGLYTRGSGAGQINQNANGQVDTRTVAMTNSVIDDNVIAFDAIDADHITASAISEIQSGLATSAALATVQADTDNLQTRIPAALVGGRMDSSVGAMATDAISAASVSTAAVEKIRDGLLNYAYRSGRTVYGLFRRLGSAIERATGLKGSTVTFFQPDGVTTEFTVTQDPTNGNRTAVNVTNSETP